MSKLVLGTVQLGLNYGINNEEGKPSLDESFRILDTAYENNISMLDTAAAYGDSENIIGKYMKEKNKYFKIASKMPKVHDNCDISSYVKNKLYNSLDNLKVPNIEYYFIHNFKDIIERPQVMRTLLEEKEKGTINNIAISLYDIEELEYLLQNYIDYFDAIQIPFNIMDVRWINSDILNRAKLKDIKVFARSIYLQGLLFLSKEKADKIHPKAFRYIELLNDFCEEHNISIKELAFQFVKCEKNVDNILIGCENSNQLIQNINTFNNNSNNLTFDQIEFFKKSFSNIEKKIIDPRMWVN